MPPGTQASTAIASLEMVKQPRRYAGFGRAKQEVFTAKFLVIADDACEVFRRGAATGVDAHDAQGDLLFAA